MNRRFFGAFGVLAVAALSIGSCKKDPLSDLDGKPTAVVTNFSYVQLKVDSTALVTASVVDARSIPLLIPVTFTPCGAFVTATVDTSFHPVPKTSTRAVLKGVSADSSCVRVSGGGVTDTVSVKVS